MPDKLWIDRGKELAWVTDSVARSVIELSGKNLSVFNIDGEEFTSETLVTHKSSALRKVIKLKQKII